MVIQTNLGDIDISSDVVATIVGYAATNCFGVKGMTITGVTDDIVRILRREAMSKGVRVRMSEGGLDIELHIAVEHGVNIPAICRSIINEVRYNVIRLTGIEINQIDIYVDSIKVG